MTQGGGRAENLDRTGLQSRLCQTSHSRRSANFVEYAKVVGLNPVADSSRPHKWHYRAEAQHTAFTDCVARKASSRARTIGQGTAASCNSSTVGRGLDACPQIGESDSSMVQPKRAASS
jgi:hypothetical protein